MGFLTNLTRANEIGANSYLLEIDGHNLVLDTGMHPKLEGWEATPLLNVTKNKKIDAIFITHAHLDHIGSLPLFHRAHPEANIFMSEPTSYLADPLLHNSVNIMKKKISSFKGYPLFTHGEVDVMQKEWLACSLEKSLSLQGEPIIEGKNDKVKFKMFDAGHILGAVGLHFESSKGTFFYTGDVNFQDQDITSAASFPEDNIDTLLIETTRGATAEADPYSRSSELKRLAQHINTVFDRGGTVLIPVFALGKTQETLTALYHMIQAGIIPSCPIYIGGLSWKLSSLYDELASRYPRLLPHLDLLEDIKPRLVNGKTVRQLRPQRGQIYLLSSGMMNHHTLSNIVGQRFLAEPRHGIFFIGYTDPQSPAGQLRKAFLEKLPVVLDPVTGPQSINCEIDYFDLTAHAQRDDLLDYILKVNPRHVLLVHGDQPALDWFQAKIKEARPQMKVTLPRPGEPVAL